MADSKNVKVSIRMYCHGLGDCFLLRFKQNDQEFKMLIDCGVLQGTEAGAEKMKCVVENIKQETGGNLDLVVATHQHYDHISGFEQAQDVFNQINFEEIWLGWTEDVENNETAKHLAEAFKGNLRGIGNALTKMQHLGLNDEQSQIKELLEGFYGEDFDDVETTDDEESLGVADKKKKEPKSKRVKAWDYILTKKQTVKPHYKYCYPGTEPLTLKGIEGVRVYVLGPPQSPEKLRNLNPPSTEKYRHGFNLNTYSLADSFFVAVNDNADDVERNSVSPFDETEEKYVIGFDESQKEKINKNDSDDFFDKFYHSDKQGKNDWRRIDEDWLGMTSEFALKMDSYTNNTSLVLAIELVESEKVLLFVGDAQSGNWESWHDYNWEMPDKNGTKQKVNAEKLLNKTVLYKVGHHASHNATLKKSGLEMMKKNDELIALIPVDSEVAFGKQPHKWEMPFDELLKDLQLKTNGRVVASDKLLLTDFRPPTADDKWQGFKIDTDNLLKYKDKNGNTVSARLFVDFEIE